MGTMRFRTLTTVTTLLALWLRHVGAAINLDESPAVEPLDSENENDPSPIDGLDRYWPDQHDCPLPCTDVTNIHSWIPYVSVGRINRCREPMLLQLSVSRPLDDPTTTALIRACALDFGSVGIAVSASEALPEVENPKLSSDLFDPSLEREPACKSEGTRTTNQVLVSSSEVGGANIRAASRLLTGMKTFFDARNNCDESFLFAYYENTVASAYIGPGLGKGTVQSTLASLSTYVDREGFAGQIIAQFCSANQTDDSNHAFGVVVDSSGSLASVQELAAQRKKGRCVRGGFSAVLPEATVWQVSNDTLSGNRISNSTVPSIRNSTLRGNGTAQRNSTFVGLFGKNSTYTGLSMLGSMSSRLRSLISTSQTATSGSLHNITNLTAVVSGSTSRQLQAA